MGHINIPIFIPHLGCPNQCIFCNQRLISGHIEFKESDVRQQIEDCLKSIDTKNNTCEIAFFGGSFTGIDRNLMIRLLDTANYYCKEGYVKAIRMSTRPDYIDDEIISILKNYPISCVELGIQTINDTILEYLKRGHSKKDTDRAINYLTNANIPFVGQMMIGLPLSTPDDEIECAKYICDKKAIGARIYPTLVFRGTELEYLTSSKEYIPLSLDDAVERSKNVLKVFVDNKVDCIRIGLCDSENLHSLDSYVAGPNHPSIGEMVISELYFDLLKSHMENEKENNTGFIEIYSPKGKVSQIIGNHKKNLIRLKELYNLKKIMVKEDSKLKEFEIYIKGGQTNVS